MKILLSLLLFPGILLSTSALAAGSSGQPAAAVVYLSGDDEIPAGHRVVAGESITTKNGVSLRLPDGSSVELTPNSAARVRSLSPASSTAKKTPTVIELTRGSIRSEVTRSDRVYRVVTPTATAGVRGTDFAVDYMDGGENATTEVDVFEGSVEVGQSEDETGEIFKAGDGATIRKKAMARRKLREEIRERWEAHREEVLEKLRKRLKLRPDANVEDMKEYLKKLPPEMREEIKNKLKNRIKAARERQLKRKATMDKVRKNHAPVKRPLPRRKPAR